MTGKTHRVGGMLGSLVGFSILQNKGMLIQDVSEPLQLVMIYASSMYGSVLSDMDHEWESCPSHDVFSWFIYKALHLTTPIRRFLTKDGKTYRIRKNIYRKFKGVLEICDSKHRSWQTHSDLAIILLVFLAYWLINRSVHSADGLIIRILCEGIVLGMLSHLVLDALTPSGIWSFILTPIKLLLKTIFGKKKKGGEKNIKKSLVRLHLVPNKSFFATNSEEESPWEYTIRNIMWFTCFILIARLIYFASPYRLYF